jgi:hypothetical protein
MASAPARTSRFSLAFPLLHHRRASIGFLSIYSQLLIARNDDSGFGKAMTNG